MSLDQKTNSLVLNRAMDLEPYDPSLGPEWTEVYIKQMLSVLKKHTRDANKAARLMADAATIDFEAYEEEQIEKLMSEDDSDADTED